MMSENPKTILRDLLTVCPAAILETEARRLGMVNDSMCTIAGDADKWEALQAAILNKPSKR